MLLVFITIKIRHLKRIVIFNENYILIAAINLYLCSGLVGEADEDCLAVKYMKRTTVHKFTNNPQFLWPEAEEIDRVKADEILCRIPHNPQPSGSKTRALFEFPDAAYIQMLFDLEKH